MLDPDINQEYSQHRQRDQMKQTYGGAAKQCQKDANAADDVAFLGVARPKAIVRGYAARAVSQG